MTLAFILGAVIGAMATTALFVAFGFDRALTSDADRLRAAAEKLREAVAEHQAATNDTSIGRMLVASDRLKALGFTDVPVALAVAAWLDDVAVWWEGRDEDEVFDPDGHLLSFDDSIDSHAAKVADAILRGAE